MYLLYLISSKNIVHSLSGQISFDLKPRYVHQQMPFQPLLIHTNHNVGILTF